MLPLLLALVAQAPAQVAVGVGDLATLGGTLGGPFAVAFAIFKMLEMSRDKKRNSNGAATPKFPCVDHGESLQMLSRSVERSAEAQERVAKVQEAMLSHLGRMAEEQRMQGAKSDEALRAITRMDGDVREVHKAILEIKRRDE